MGRGSGTCAFTPVAVVLGKSFVFCPLAVRGIASLFEEIASLFEEIAQELNSVARILGDPPAMTSSRLVIPLPGAGAINQELKLMGIVLFSPLTFPLIYG
jgi:ABC-type sulfate transport system permease component